ncbi:MAG: TonB-dependent receptor plug domain-containing protein [Bacteroidota bacterium]|nr:TonB-dependent receptor plug domain-containing protein [Bacteroidota bacterium]
MKSFILPVIALFFAFQSLAQNTFTAVVRDSETKGPLTGATVLIRGTAKGIVTDQNGFAQIPNIPDGKCVIVFTYIGYKEKADNFNFPLVQQDTVEIFLSASDEEMDEVIITATRSSRTIENTPTRLEAISGEELEEKGNMKPGDIRMMLNESTGIQTQQTSATSYNSSIRIQGLDGKYTQILRDGFPLYSGFSGGLGLLQVVPLDLKQVEVIKGASSTLYGGGAIAGLVNLVSRMPKEERELNFLLNGTSAVGMDISGFYAWKLEKTGSTVFASYNSGNAYDPADIGFTAIPKYRRVTLNPRLYVYASPKTTLNMGFNSTIENRTGGDMQYIEGKGDDIHFYFEKNQTNRFSTQFGVNHQMTDSVVFRLKNSFSYYDRKIEIPDFAFSGIQFSSFTEATYAIKRKNLEWITGLNLWTERFSQDKTNTASLVNYNHTTFGAFVQNSWTASDLFSLETGIRGDYQNEYGFFLLPRLAALFKFNSSLSARLGGGLGYKTPTVFTEDAERLQFRNLLPVDHENTKAEQSVGGNLDFNYRTSITSEMSFSLNTLFFYTRILKPLVLTQSDQGFYEFLQPDGFIDTKGVELNAKLTYSDSKLFVGYTLADVNQQMNGVSTAFPLVAKHRLNNVLMYELDEKLKVGLEAYYYSKQKLNDGGTGQAYWICGLMAERLWERFSVFVNFENMLDTRQTRFGSIYTGPVSNPVFMDIYAPVDGFVVNGGIKLRL